MADGRVRLFIDTIVNGRGVDGARRQVQGLTDDVRRLNRESGSGGSGGSGGGDDPTGGRGGNAFIRQITGRINAMVRRLLILNVISKAFASFKKYLSGLITQDSELSASLESMKANLASAFTPIWNACLPAIRTLLNWVVQLTAGIAQVITSIFGLQRATGAASKSASKSAKSAGKAAKSANFLGIDEIHTINTQGSGGAGSAATPSSEDLGGITEASELWQNIAKAVLLVGATLGAMKLASIFKLIGSGPLAKLKAFLGIALAIAGTFELVTGIIDAWKNGIDKLNSTQMFGGLLAAVGGIAIAFGPTAAAIAGIVGGLALVVTAVQDIIKNGPNIDNICTLVEGAGVAIAAIAILIGGIPGLIVAIVAGVAAIGAFVVQHWQDIKAWAAGVAAWVNEHVWQPILTFLQPVLDWITQAWENLKTSCPLVQWFSDTLGTIVEGVKTFVSDVAGFFTSLWTGITTGDWSGMEAWANGVWDHFKAGASGLVGIVGGYFQAIWDTIVGIFPGMQDWADGVWNAFSSGAALLGTIVGGFFTSLWAGITTGDWSTMETWATSVWGAFSAGASALVDVVGGYFSDIWSAITGVFTGVQDWFTTNVWTPITTVFDTVKAFFEGVAGDIWGGLTGGLTSGFEAAKRAVVDTFSSIWGGVLDFFGIHSPSTLAATDGGYLMDGFTDGVSGKEASVGESLKGVFAGIWDVAKSAWDSVTGWLGDLFGWGGDDDKKAETAENTATGKADEIAGAVATSFDGTSEAISDPVETGATAAILALDGIATAATLDCATINNEMGTVGRSVIVLGDLVMRNLGTAWSEMVTACRGAYEEIQGVFTDMTSWFQRIFGDAWTGVIKVFSASGSVFRGIRQGVADTFKAIVNSFINGLNSVLNTSFSQINRALSTIRAYNVNGYKPFSGLASVSAPKIPRLAQGAVIPANHEFLAVLGDQTRGTNIEAPLDTIVDAMKTALGGSLDLNALAGAIVSGIRASGLGVVNLDGRQLAASINRESQRVGHAVLK